MTSASGKTQYPYGGRQNHPYLFTQNRLKTDKAYRKTVILCVLIDSQNIPLTRLCVTIIISLVII